MMPTATSMPRLRNFADDFDFREFAARHFQMNFVDRQIEECGKQRRVAPQADGAPFVIAEAEMGGKTALPNARV